MKVKLLINCIQIHILSMSSKDDVLVYFYFLTLIIVTALIQPVLGIGVQVLFFLSLMKHNLLQMNEVLNMHFLLLHK